MRSKVSIALLLSKALVCTENCVVCIFGLDFRIVFHDRIGLLFFGNESFDFGANVLLCFPLKSFCLPVFVGVWVSSFCFMLVNGRKFSVIEGGLKIK